MDLYPKFDDTRGIPARYFVIWLSTSALLMLLEALVARQIIGSLFTLMVLPFAMMANLYVKQGEYYDLRTGYTRADRYPWLLWAMPIFSTGGGIALGFFIIIVELYKSFF